MKATDLVAEASATEEQDRLKDDDGDLADTLTKSPRETRDAPRKDMFGGARPASCFGPRRRRRGGRVSESPRGRHRHAITLIQRRRHRRLAQAGGSESLWRSRVWWSVGAGRSGPGEARRHGVRRAAPASYLTPSTRVVSERGGDARPARRSYKLKDAQ